jgi:hypothetical protein
MGWSVTGNILESLFLGGQLTLLKDRARVQLWIDPRISKATKERIGWRSIVEHIEPTPDFLFTVGSDGFRDAFILDATLSSDLEVQTSKGKYRDCLIGEDIQFIAGIPVQRRPLRSWAIAPGGSAYCNLFDPFGWTGVVPIDVTGNSTPALDAWLLDVLTHAQLHPQ